MNNNCSVRCVIVAVDGSEESMTALKWALNNVKLLRSSIDEKGGGGGGGEEEEEGSFIVLHVQPPPSLVAGINPRPIPFGGPSDFEVPAFSAAIEAHQKRITRAILSHALKICSDKNVKVKPKVVVGDPKEKICETVDELHAELLVMGSRAFGPIKRMFLGSVSDYCSNHVQCPVMIVKASTSDSAMPV